jgi:hypothetical protein
MAPVDQPTGVVSPNWLPLRSICSARIPRVTVSFRAGAGNVAFIWVCADASYGGGCQARCQTNDAERTELQPEGLDRCCGGSPIATGIRIALYCADARFLAHNPRPQTRRLAVCALSSTAADPGQASIPERVEDAHSIARLTACADSVLT